MFLRCSRSTFLVWFVKGSVFLEGFKVTLLWRVVFVIWFRLHSGLPSGLWGLDVALGVRVNQYKLFVCISLSLKSFKFCF